MTSLKSQLSKPKGEYGKEPKLQQVTEMEKKGKNHAQSEDQFCG